MPIWINISFIESRESFTVFNLETSLRFRKPSLLRYADTGHASFKAVLDVRLSLSIAEAVIIGTYLEDSEDFHRLKAGDLIYKI